MTLKRRLLLVKLGFGFGGAERLAVNLVNGWQVRGVETTVLSLNDNNPMAAEFSPGACEFIHRPRRRWSGFSLPALIRRLAVDKRFESILAFGLYEFLAAKIAVMHMETRPRLFLSIHQTTPPTRVRLVKNWIMARAITPEDRVISVCRAQADYWHRRYGIPDHLFINIYNGVDAAFFSRRRAPLFNAREHYGISDDSLVIVQVASLTPHKRQAISIRALQHAKTLLGSRKWYLMLVGGGDKTYEVGLREFATSLGVRDSVLFCGVQPDPRPFYAAADLFTLSSTAVETFSVAALEAMAMGLPCVLTDVGGAREMIVNDAYGCLRPPEMPNELAEAWLEILTNLNRYNPRIIREHVVQHFDLQSCVSNYLEVLFPSGEALCD